MKAGEGKRAGGDGKKIFADVIFQENPCDKIGIFPDEQRNNGRGKYAEQKSGEEIDIALVLFVLGAVGRCIFGYGSRQTADGDGLTENADRHNHLIQADLGSRHNPRYVDSEYKAENAADDSCNSKYNGAFDNRFCGHCPSPYRIFIHSIRKGGENDRQYKNSRKFSG